MKKLLLLALLCMSRCAIGQTPISALPNATTSTSGVEVFPVVQSASTRKMSLAQIQAFLEGATNLWSGANTFSQAITGVGYSGGPISGTFGTFTGAITGGSYSGGPISGTTGTFTGTVTMPCATVAATTFTSTCTTVPWPTTKFAYGVIDGIGGCTISSNVASANITGCIHNATGNYTVNLASIWTLVPTCTVTIGSGSEGGSNAAGVQSGTTFLSGTYKITILSFSPTISAQDNDFQITCLGQ
jgi:hypothetical protein